MARDSVKVALVQMISSQRVEPNLQAAERLINEAASASPAAIFLPENFAALAAADPIEIGQSETEGQLIQSFLARMARETGAYIFGGTVPLATRPDGVPVPDNRVRAASLVYSPDGTCMARYDKMHMFDVDVSDNHRVYRESATFEPGEAPVDVVLPFGRVGLSVCYDIRFPEFYRKLFEAGVDVIAVPSAFTRVTGEAHFSVLMRARAIENSCFTLAACQGGDHDSGRQTYGHSMIVGPWGDVIAELGEGEGVLNAELDLSVLNQIRTDMPFSKQRKIL